ncbi:GyrI-like domain-containing protein [Spirosoma endophyticum]|nr:GyrI-like domain-containing protein [Spirosoma endophyticum]
MTTQLSILENALQVTEIPAFTALTFTTCATLLTLSQHVGGVAENLHYEAARLNLDVTGPIQWVYTGVNGDETNEFQLEIALPINQPDRPSAQFTYQVFPSFRCVSYNYTGPWSDLGELYTVLFAQLYRDGYQSDGRIREVYSKVDFENMANCVTEIQIAII